MYAGALFATVLIIAFVFGTAMVLAFLTEPHQVPHEPVQDPLDLTRQQPASPEVRRAQDTAPRPQGRQGSLRGGPAGT